LKLFVSINIIQINNGQLRIAPRTLDIECTTNCLAEGTYYAVVTLMDNVGLERVLYAEIVLGPECDIDVREDWPAPPDECVSWATSTSDTIGQCWDGCIF
jgi:hypothetical protein